MFMRAVVSVFIIAMLCTRKRLKGNQQNEGNALVPVATAQKGFVPSFAWFDGTPNTTAVQEKPQHQQQKESINVAYQNHYLQHLSPQLSSTSPWAPSTSSPPPHYSVAVSMQRPDLLILLCQVQEPLEHISWLWYPCPNRDSSDDGILIADGTTVSNASLYAVRIIGENGVFISELHILQNPLQPGIAGLYRCEAWPHGAGKDSANYQASSTYHDEFVIGGHFMINSCFYDPHKHKYYHQHYGPSTYNHKLQKSYRTPRTEGANDVTANIIDGRSEVNRSQMTRNKLTDVL
ncbi:uncharacterized protein LOC110828506 isoform X2 [Zootermopsis nevadensis]|uniref:uncharacterized protein LOC110828506 isoform X2 n=1 Tax=Zootermopsis nevadensis TaxID=136037 RepID=UPI000B8E71DE|nr:uncharacterized protein LOC110828506 isoform X2 [Zootermopsis nevadensis]